MFGLERVVGNRLDVEDGVLTGGLVGSIADSGTKLRVLQEEAALLGKGAISLATGDGANDIPMLQAAGLGIAFGRRDKIRRAADGAIRRPDLSGILYLLGVTGRDLAALRRRRQA